MQNPSGLTHNLNKDSSIFSRGQDPLGRLIRQEEQNQKDKVQSEIIVSNPSNRRSGDNPSFASVVSQNAFSSFPPTYPLMPTPLPSQPALIKDTFNLDEFTRKIKKQRREIPTIPISASNTPIGIPSDAKQSLR
jgi:hypothetical protein